MESAFTSAPPGPEPSQPQPLWPKVMFAILTVCVLVLGYLVYDLNQKAARLQEKQLAAEAQLHQELAAARAELKATSEVMTSRLGMTQKQLDQRAAILRREQQASEDRITQQEQEGLKAVNGEVAGVKSEVGSAKTTAEGTRTDLDATKARLERAVGDLGVQSGLIAHTASDLELLKHKGDRNYYEFTLLKNAKKPSPVGTVSLQLRKTDAKHGKYTMNVIADDKLIEKKDRNVNEPVQFYSGRDHNLFEVVVFTVDKDKATGYLSTPKGAPAPMDVGPRSN